MTTYQRLKIENAELKARLYQVCIYPESISSLQIIAEQNCLHNIESAIWAADLKNTDPVKFDGLMKQLHAS